MKLPRFLRRRQADGPPVQRRAGANDPWDVDVWSSLYPALRYGGENISSDQAVRIAAVMACVRLLSETVASLPLHLYRRLPGGGKERVTDTEYATFVERPNRQQSGVEFREMLQGHLALRGNAYAHIQWRGDLSPEEVWPLHPDRVAIEHDGQLIQAYKYTREDGTQTTFWPSEILHLRGLSSDGVVGLSPIQYAAKSLHLALDAENYGRKFFQNGARATGAIQLPTQLSEAARERLRDGLRKQLSGDNIHKPIVLEEGATWQQITIPPEEAQFLETRKFQVTEIARIFRVPPHMIADLDKATFSNITEQSIEFVTYCLLPWIRRWESRLNYTLLQPRKRRDLFYEFVLDGLLRGKPLERTQALQLQFMHGVISRNEWRAMENRNPVDGGDDYFVPANLQRADAPLQMDSEAPFAAMLQNAAERLSAAQIRTAKRQTTTPKFHAWLTTYDITAYAAEVMQPIAAAFGRRFDVEPIRRAQADIKAECEGQTDIDRIIQDWQANLPAMYRRAVEESCHALSPSL